MASEDRSLRESLTDVTPRRERLGRYVLHAILGRGGMATVHLSRMVGERGFERWVAVKRMHEHLLEDEPTRQMFLDEARMAARLHHPNLVQVTDFGEVADQPYLVMEYINGETLSTILRRCRAIGDPLPIPLAARIVAWACEGLHHAHELKGSDGEPLNLVHRDVSPQNILVSYEGVVKVTDFGIAKAAGRIQQTRTGQMKGKVSYMSPEQVLAQRLDRRSDIFALGIVLFEATLGRRLFRRDSELETLQRITAAEVPFPSAIDPRFPQAVEQVILRSLQQRPDDRYLTAKEMQRDLEQYLVQTGRPTGTTELAELMEALFAEKRANREQMMNAAAITEPEGVDIDVELELSPTTLSLPDGIAIRPPSKSTLRTGLLVGISVLLGAVITIVAVMLLSSSEADDVAGQGGQASVVPTTPDRPQEDPRQTPNNGSPRVDAGAGAATPPPPAKSADGGAEANLSPARDATTADTADVAPAMTKTKRRPQPDRSPPGTLSVMARPWCDVYLGGRRLGRTPIVGVQVPSGRRTLRFMPLGKGPAHRRVVNVRAGQNTPVSVDLTR